jgi:hypothetical protein
MKNTLSRSVSALAFALLAGPAIAAQATLITLDDIDYRKPDKLVEMMALDDTAYQNLLANDWKRVESTLHKFIPAGVDFAPPVPLAFYGPWKSCLTTHFPAACREHTTQLIGLMQSKAAKKQQAAAVNPF